MAGPYPTNEFGRREGLDERRRLLVLVVLAAVTVVLNMSLGHDWTRQRIESLEQVVTEGDWGKALLNDVAGTLPVPLKLNGLRRIGYLSNSHALTGGRVAWHMQDLLDRAAPGHFEVVDLAAAGIFAPDFLQRMARAEDYDFDSVVVASAYISFSDRMGLIRQAESARSFFNRGVVGRLSAAFWLRNYDIGLYLNTLAARYFSLFRYRPKLYALWSKPFAGLLKQVTGSEVTLFLDIRIQQSWRFPDGFDRNLFQWRLYSTGRDGHLGDMKELVDRVRSKGMPLLAINLPIHWEKGTYRHDPKDYGIFRREMAEIYSGATEFIDYQGRFPTEFATYDALHPTWIGARLYALDELLRLLAIGSLPGITAQELLGSFLNSGEEQAIAYGQIIDAPVQPLSTKQLRAFRRFDLLDAENARLLLSRSISYRPDSRKQSRFLSDLAVRMRYFSQVEFPVPAEWQEEPLATAYRQSLTDARSRINQFSERLKRLHLPRLTGFPLPALGPDTLRESSETYLKFTTIGSNTKPPEPIKVIFERHVLADGTKVERVLTVEGRPFAVSAINVEQGTGYRRVDTLGDGSFLSLQPPGAIQTFPPWVISKKPRVRFGV